MTRFVAVGFVPGLTRAQFSWKLLHPLTFAGFRETLGAMTTNALRKNATRGAATARAVTLAAAVMLFWWVGGPKALLFGYVLPLVTVYPFFSWISVLAEHRS